ncbi:hypothetical protein BKA59DRAFT_172943 [Fusarium tricinctum]|uniref:DUF7704 domain-containing protein n=1 Tax=Fusarium tricinctum TaxID=61284 RepID=A0A8K0RY08_9HYPO|nr:hypothetical protein BKA59DRAFT_172943 [Fusarium tricinctum]
MASAKTVPAFYRIIFTYVDPVIAFATGYGLVFHRDAMLGMLSPLFTPRAVAYDPWLWQVAAAYWMTAVIQGGLLRYTDDLGIWKICNGTICIMDVMLLFSMWEMRQPPHNWSMATMSHQDWSNVYGAAIFAVIRIFFILEVGFSSQKNKKKTRSA